MGWLEDRIAKWRVIHEVEQAKEARQLREQQRTQAAANQEILDRRRRRDLERQREGAEVMELHRRDWALLQELGVLDMLEEMRRTVWRRGKQVNFSTGNFATSGYALESDIGIEFRYTGLAPKESGEYRPSTTSFDSEGYPDREPIMVDAPHAVVDGIYVGIISKGPTKNSLQKTLIVKSIKSSPHQYPDESMHRELLRRKLGRLDVSERRQVIGQIQDALARDVVERQREGRLPATLRRRHGPGGIHFWRR